MKHWLRPWLGPVMLATSIAAVAQSPFSISASVTNGNEGFRVRVAFAMPTNHLLYAERLSFEVEGEPATQKFTVPEPTEVRDKFSGESKRVFRQSFDADYRLTTGLASDLLLTVRFQGCDEANCFFPEERTFAILADGTVKPVSEPETVPDTTASGDWQALAGQFEIKARGGGYLSEAGFIRFLDRAERSSNVAESESGSRGGWGMLVTICLIVLGGAGLNLTPCILPMIPINLAIIGAGAQAGSKRNGFVLGGVYAAGMAIAYGVLGLIVVLTGSRFGTLNSSPWFNAAMALVFLVLALGMFGILTIDLSRFQGPTRGGPASPRSRFFVAYSMGTVAALLAGACVAPVVISVLVQSTALYNRGIAAGLFLPFLLGIGMGLPWPFAGAGLSFLPKPGVWMTRVKYGFGVLILLFGGYYGVLSFTLFRSATRPLQSAATEGERQTGNSTSSDELVRVLRQARKEGKPVLIDFWASWCKNCSAMEHTTFKSPAVKRRLESYLLVRFQAERPNQSGTKEVLDYFGALGLPTYVVMKPRATEPSDESGRTVAAALPTLTTPDQVAH